MANKSKCTSSQIQWGQFSPELHLMCFKHWKESPRITLYLVEILDIWLKSKSAAFRQKRFQLVISVVCHLTHWASQLRSEKSFKRYLGQAQRVVSESLFVLLQLPRHHLPRPEVETSQVHRVSQVAGQLRFTPELLPGRTEEEGWGERARERRGDRMVESQECIFNHHH